MPVASTDFRHDALLVGFKPIDDLHREFQDILDALLESVSDARRRFDGGDIDGTRKYCADLLEWFALHARTEDLELANFLKGSPQ